MRAMVTPDGHWRVEVINLDGRDEYRVTRDGILAGGCSPQWKDQGRHHTVASVAATLGHAFASLVPA
jgi:hypothetical protein